MALKTMLEQMNEARKKLNEAKSTITQQVICEALGEEVPEGYVLVWAQYTLYFNDGSPCRFGVREPILVPEVDDLNDITHPWGDRHEAWTPGLEEAWGQVYDDDLMESVFGDHKMVRVRRGGEFLVTRYTDHD